MMKFLLTFIGIFLLGNFCSGQNVDTSTTKLVKIDSSKSEYVDTLGVGFWKKIVAPVYPNPERAAALSFVLPGAGQVYNKKLWFVKVPVIYAGYAFLIFNGESNRLDRNRFQTAYLLALNEEPHEFTGTRFDNPETLRVFRDDFDKNFQLSYIGLAVFHIIQTLEAYTTAHLMNFDIDDSLSLGPSLIPRQMLQNQVSFTPGLRMTYNLGR